MKKQDIFFGLLLIFALILFIPNPLFAWIQQGFFYNPSYWYITSFIKFGILSTFGEVLGLRISSGTYIKKGFGILPRAIVWGILGIGIKMAFVIFASGVPVLMNHYFGMTQAIDAMATQDIFDAMDENLGMDRLVTAFAISTFMNLIFAPVFMTLHKITDSHILSNGGSLRGFFKPIAFGKIFPSLNWFVQWDFVFKKSIPFFWIPAHTITFLMPSEYRVVFAAILGVILGLILAIAAQKSKA